MYFPDSFATLTALSERIDQLVVRVVQLANLLLVRRNGH
jgi:hypothetical protein